MIRFSNGHEIEFVTASGAMAYDGHGWFWERILGSLNMIEPELFVHTTRTLTLYPIKGNLRWLNPLTWFPWSPWSCVKLLPGGGIVNKVAFTNPGFSRWCKKVGIKYLYGNPQEKNLRLIVSIYGNEEELVTMIRRLNDFQIVAIEINPSCPNLKHKLGAGSTETQTVVRAVRAACLYSKHPVIIKVSVAQDYETIVRELQGLVQAVSFNSVPWDKVFPNLRSPLMHLKTAESPGVGGVSGRPAQPVTKVALEKLMSRLPHVPLILPHIMDAQDLRIVPRPEHFAWSFGAIHLPDKWKPWTIFTNPCKPTRIVKELLAKREAVFSL